MPGRQETRVWAHNPDIYAPPKYRRACRYETHFPDRLADLRLTLPANVLGTVADAEHAIRDLNESAHPALAPLARSKFNECRLTALKAQLLLRTESIASSKVEGMHAGVRELARAEVGVGEGGASPTAREILANIAAMELAIRESASVHLFESRTSLRCIGV